MNIQSVQAFDAAVGKLDAIKGNVTSEQLSGLTELFSTNIWNTSDAEGTKANLERQLKELEQLLDKIQAEIDALYQEQKNGNEQMNRLLNDINEESYQASKQLDQNAKKQQDLVNSATDEAYRLYMKGEISKDEIPMKISELLAKSNPGASSSLNAVLASMDANGQKIYSLSDKIAGILDQVNTLTAKYKTTEASIGLMKQLIAQVPEHKERADIQSTMQKPVFTPTQEALGDKLIDAYKVENDGKWADGNQGTSLMKEALAGSGPVTEERKMQLDAMSAEEKAAAVEEADTSKYSAVELLYLSGMDAHQAGSAIGHIFNGAGIGYNEETGAIMVPFGHDATRDLYRNLEDQYKTLWGGDIERGSETAQGDKGGADPFSWRQGDTTFTLAIDRDKDNVFDGANEFVGAEQGWAEMTAADTDGDGTLTADEMVAAGFSVMENDQALTGGGTYGWNGVKESGVKSIDLNSFKEITGIKSTNLNGNTRAGEFNVTLADQNGDGVDDVTLGKQTINTEEYNEMFYSHTYGEAFSFGLNPDEVANVLAEAAKPENYTELEEFKNEMLVENTEYAIEHNTKDLQAQEEAVNSITDDAKLGHTNVANTNKKENEETATNTTDNTSNTNANEAEDDYIEEEN